MNPSVVFRPATYTDLSDIYELATQTGHGMTNLIADKKLLSAKIEDSLISFNTNSKDLERGLYFFVLENIANKKIIGTAAIFSKAGGELPFYSYKVAREELVSKEANINHTIHVLHLLHDHHTSSEVASLFLSPDFRINKNGELLSRSRFLFMAAFPERFNDLVIAEMRGISDANGISPFWDSLGRNFFAMDFQDADEYCSFGKKQFIIDLMPKHPIYVSLLSKNAQKVIGKVHKDTLPAKKLLEREGFNYEGYVDIFDAGPTLQARFNNIRTIKKSMCKEAVINDSIIKKSKNMYLLGNEKLNFRSCVANAIIEDEKIIISSATANCLESENKQIIRTIDF